MLHLWAFTHSDFREKMSVSVRKRIAWINDTESGMSTLSPVEEDSLLSPAELQAQREWDLEFQRRKDDLARQELKSRERRRAVSDKMTQLRDRWQRVERRRQLRSRESGRGDNTSSSLGISSSQHTGSHRTTNASVSNHGNMFDSNNTDASREPSSGDSTGLNR